MKGYVRILAAIPGFFLSSLFVMLFSRSIAPQIGYKPVDYVFAMLITIALWIAAAPLLARKGKSVSGWLFGKIMGPMMKSMMPKMIPKMMEGMFGSMEGKDMGDMMHDVMPKMMDGCFSKMDSGERRGMLNMCHSMLAGMEEKYFGEQDEQGKKRDEEET